MLLALVMIWHWQGFFSGRGITGPRKVGGGSEIVSDAILGGNNCNCIINSCFAVAMMNFT